METRFTPTALRRRAGALLALLPLVGCVVEVNPPPMPQRKPSRPFSMVDGTPLAQALKGRLGGVGAFAQPNLYMGVKGRRDVAALRPQPQADVVPAAVALEQPQPLPPEQPQTLAAGAPVAQYLRAYELPPTVAELQKLYGIRAVPLCQRDHLPAMFCPAAETAPWGNRWTETALAPVAVAVPLPQRKPAPRVAKRPFRATVTFLPLQPLK